MSDRLSLSFEVETSPQDILIDLRLDEYGFHVKVKNQTTGRRNVDSMS